MIDFAVYQDTGPIVGGRGTPKAVMDFNMKDSGVYEVFYYPTQETDAAPLIRPTLAGEQTLSFKVFTYFVLSGTYNVIKNLRFKVSVETMAQASDAQLFYKMTNVYEAPNKNFDGDMMLLGQKNSTVITPTLYPNLSMMGPHMATTRATSYSNASPLYTNYFVTQMRVNKGSLVGNTAEFKLRFEAFEYYEV